MCSVINFSVFYMTSSLLLESVYLKSALLISVIIFGRLCSQTKLPKRPLYVGVTLIEE